MTTATQYALVTGASSGIGFELAKLLAQDGYSLVIVGRKQNSLEKTAEQLKAINNNIKVVPIAKDLFNKNAAFELYDLVKAKGLEIEVLVNDAGQGQYGKFIETDIHRELDIIQLNISSVVIL